MSQKLIVVPLVNRWTPIVEERVGLGTQASMDPCNDGRFVEYHEYEALADEVQRLRARLDCIAALAAP
jgi:hypothetical protein